MFAMKSAMCIAQVVNPKTRVVCKPYEHGEICIKSETMMMGYLNRPASDYFDHDGFGMTGDLGYYDDYGTLYYVDRIKELIKYVHSIVTEGCTDMDC